MAACGGGRQRQTVTTCQTTRAARRRAAPAAHMRPRPAGRTTPAQKRHPRAKQTAGARRVPPPPKSTKFLVLCASVRPGSQNANFVDLAVAAAPPRGAIHPPGARGPRPPLFGGLRRSLYGGVLRHPPMGALCFVPRENHQKKFVMVADMSGFFRVSPSNNCKNRVFGGRTPPPVLGEKKVDSPLISW